MLRNQILEEIKTICVDRYQKIEDWNHDIYHVRRVVKLAKKIAEKEKMRSKDIFLVELAAWLHDLGRAGEDKGISFEKSKHAERSYRQARNILKKYSRFIGREGVYSVLEAVREHSLPILIHRDNKISKVLQDADRGASINLIGVFSILDFRGIVEDLGPIRTVKQAREDRDRLLREIIKNKKQNKALKALNNLREFYYGRQEKGEWVVLSLHTESARKMFKKHIKEVEDFIDLIK